MQARMVWALPVSLAATQGIARTFSLAIMGVPEGTVRPERKFSDLLSIPPGTEMFHFPGYAPRMRAVTADGSGVSPFGHFRI